MKKKTRRNLEKLVKSRDFGKVKSFLNNCGITEWSFGSKTKIHMDFGKFKKLGVSKSLLENLF